MMQELVAARRERLARMGFAPVCPSVPAERVGRRPIDRRQSLPQRLIAAVARRHGVDVSDIIGPSRRKVVIAARHEAISFVARRCGWMTLVQIGKEFGRDHTSVLWAIKSEAKRTGKTIKGHRP